MSLTALELIASLTRTSSNDLAEIANKMGATNFEFKVNERARTMHSQLTECAVINQWSAQIFNERKMMSMNMDESANFFLQAEAEYETFEKALGFLASSTESLIKAIESFPPEKQDDTLVMPWGENRTFLTLATLAIWNMNYHVGQINYIFHYLLPETK